MKSKLFISVLAFVMFAESGCSVYSVIYTDHSSTIDFRNYKTFAWLPGDSNSDDTPYHNQIIEANTKNYFTHEFLARGMTVHVDSPDVLMQLVIKAANKQKTEQVPITSPPLNQYNNSYSQNPYSNPYNNPYNYNPYNYQATSPQNPYYNPYPNQYNYNVPTNYNYNNYGNYGYTTRIVNYTESTITLNIIDRKLNQIVWTTTVEGDLYDPSEMQNNLHPAVLRILDSYPIKSIPPQKYKIDANYK